MKKGGKKKRSLIRIHPGIKTKENKIVMNKSASAAATTRKGSAGPSEQERKSVAEVRAVRLQAERQMRQYDRVMAREAEKTKRNG